MKELIGKMIRQIFVGEGEQILQFVTDAGIVSYKTYGDCCSETWFADILGVSALIGGHVQSVESIEIPEVADNRTRQEVDSFYGYRLVTDKGSATIVFRNSSNGYYGGSIDYLELDSVTPGAREITDDWSA